MRNGLGLFENGDRSFLHAFDGFAKLTSWRFLGNGSVFFSTRFLASSFYNDSMTSASIAPYLLFDSVSPSFTFLERMKAIYHGIDNMNANVVRLPRDDGGYDYLALSDFWKVYEIFPDRLGTGTAVTSPLKGSHGTLLNNLFLNLLSSAHPLPEPRTDKYLTFLSSISVLPWIPSRMQLVRVLSTSQREVVASWEVERVAYMHSFSVTQTHALLLAHPMYVNVPCMITRVTPFDCLDWRPDITPGTLYVVNLQSGEVTSLTMDTVVFTMHHINAFNLQTEGQIILDLSAYPDPKFVASLRLSILRDPSRRNNFPVHTSLLRFLVDLRAKTVQQVVLTPPQQPSLDFVSRLDMPSINECFRARKYCFVYGVVVKMDNSTLSKVAIVKRDVCGLGRDRAWLVPNHYPVEPLFVPNPQGLEEDDGVVLVPMIDGHARRSYLAVLDAHNLVLIAKSYLPTVVPYSLHGHFFEEIV